MISPRAGSEKRNQNRAAITRSSTRSVRTIDGDGTRYGLMTHSCTTNAIRPAMSSVPTTSSTLRLRCARTARSGDRTTQAIASTTATASAIPMGPRRKSSNDASASARRT